MVDISLRVTNVDGDGDAPVRADTPPMISDVHDLLRLLRLALCGALLAISLTSTILGHSDSGLSELLFGIVGFALVFILRAGRLVWAFCPMDIISALTVENIHEATFGTACAAVCLKVGAILYSGRRPSAKVCAAALLHGTAVLPFVLMVLSVFLPSILHPLKGTAEIGIAGGIGLFFVVEEIATN
jgi:hypothetical protein